MVVLFMPNFQTVPPTPPDVWILGPMLGILVVGVLTGLIIIAVLLFKLVERRNEHFKRSRTLREGLLKLLEEHEGKTSSRIANLRSIHSDLNASEDTKSPGLYAILSVLVPFVVLYVMYFLTKDIGEHDRRERIFFRNFTDVSEDIGVTVVYPEWKKAPDRSAGLYVVLTLAIGIFAIYWLWTLIKDPHKHFDSHRILEDHLSSAM